MLKKLLLFIGLLVLLLIAILLFNTFRFRSKQIHVAAITSINVDEAALALHLAQALRFQTISSQDPGAFKSDEFVGLRTYLEHTFPKVHSTLTREVVGYSLLYTWKGQDEQLKPILLAAHLDVVPVEAVAETKWHQPPFEGVIADGYVWGRGAMDDKSSVMGILEAAEKLLAEGFQPRRTIYLAFGHDEEVGGRNGASKIAELLRERRIELEFVLDEGLVISEGILPLSAPVALIGIAEKGSVSLELTVEDEGGHSSIPPEHTAIGVLSAAIRELEDHKMPGGLSGISRQLFEYIGPEMSVGKRLVFANLWLFKPLVERQLSASPRTDAALRTTTAVTMIEGGVKENVLPTRARAVINFRILPGDTIESVVAHARATVKDSRVKINRYGGLAWEPSAVSDTSAASFQLLQRTIREIFPEVVAAPALVLGATDSRHYAALSTNIYRFLPQRFGPDDVKRYHGVDERISAGNYAQCVRFYYQLIKDAAEKS